MNKVINYRIIPLILLNMLIGILLVSMLGIVYGLAYIAMLSAVIAITYIVRRYRYLLKRAVICFIFTIVAIVSTNIILVNANQDFLQENVVITGVITADTAFNPESEVTSRVIILDNVVYNDVNELKKKVKVILPQSLINGLHIGDRITVFGDIYSQKLVMTDSFSVNDYCDGIRYSIKFEELGSVEKGSLNIFDNIKVYAKQKLGQYAPNSAEVIFAMIFGNKGNMDKVDNAIFSNIGIAHLFAVSGLHIGIIAGGIYLILAKFKVNKYAKLAVLLPILFLYAFLCGFSPSIMRSIIMIIIFQLSSLFGRRNDSISTLCLAGIVILLANPVFLFDLSFILTMMSVVGILYFYKPISKSMSKLPKWLATALALAISVNIAVLPILLHYFGKVSMIFLLSSVLIVPIVSMIFPFLLIAVIISFVSYLGVVLVPFNYFFIGVTKTCVWLASIPFLKIQLNVRWWFIALYVAILTFLSPYVMWRGKAKKIISLASIVIFGLTTLVTSLDIVTKPSTVLTISSNEYGSNELIIVGRKAYLISNDRLSSYVINSAMKILYSYDIYEIESVVKGEFTSGDIAELESFSSLGLIKSYCLYSGIENDLVESVDGKIYDSIIEEDISIVFNKTYNEIVVTTNDIDILFVDTNGKYYINEPLCEYELVYTNGACEYIYNFNPQYIVSEIGYSNKVIGTVPSSFTFRLHNGKIIKR